MKIKKLINAAINSLVVQIEFLFFFVFVYSIRFHGILIDEPIYGLNECAARRDSFIALYIDAATARGYRDMCCRHIHSFSIKIS